MAGDHVEILVHIDGDDTAGIDWIAANDMKTVLLRHAPLPTNCGSPAEGSP